MVNFRKHALDEKRPPKQDAGHHQESGKVTKPSNVQPGTRSLRLEPEKTQGVSIREKWFF